MADIHLVIPTCSHCFLAVGISTVDIYPSSEEPLTTPESNGASLYCSVRLELDPSLKILYAHTSLMQMR